jgi:hypothetical protein
MSSYGIRVAQQEFHKRSEASLPIAIYDASDEVTWDFRNAFISRLATSKRYDLKAVSGNYTTFRLTELRDHEAIRDLMDIRLCLVDPRLDRVVRAHAVHQLRERGQQETGQAIAREVDRVRTDVYVTIVALYDLRYSLTTSVFLHGDLPSCRCELFDEGMFLTYYIGRKSYPETLEFAATSIPFAAHAMNAALSQQFATKYLNLGATGPSSGVINDEGELIDLLTDLGCQEDLNELRDRKEQRFRTYRSGLARLWVKTGQLF